MENNIVPESDNHLEKPIVMNLITDSVVYLIAVIHFEFQSKSYQIIRKTFCKLFGHTWKLKKENNQPYFCKSCTKLYES